MRHPTTTAAALLGAAALTLTGCATTPDASAPTTPAPTSGTATAAVATPNPDADTANEVTYTHLGAIPAAQEREQPMTLGLLCWNGRAYTVLREGGYYDRQGPAVSHHRDPESDAQCPRPSTAPTPGVRP